MSYTGNSPVSGMGAATPEQIQAWFEHNATAGATYVGLPEVAIDPAVGVTIHAFCRLWNVNADLLAALIAHESAWLQSRICRDKNNPGGFGAENDDPYGKAVTFATLADGIRAVVAHVAGYVHGDGDWNQYSSRYAIVKANGWAGTVRKLTDLNGKYAWPGDTYGQSVARIANDLLAFIPQGSKEETMRTEIPGFIWRRAEPTHFSKGRSKPIRGGAQHYSAGTNSIDWLTWASGRDDPKKRVSAHFLVKHHPTMQDRGYQMVSIRDVAWATAHANEEVVAVEYEHTGNEPIPDIAYDVLIQTWKDIAEFVMREKLGSIAIIDGHKAWVQNPSLICPDGIDVQRIVRGVFGKPNPEPKGPDLSATKDPYGSPWGEFWILDAFLREMQEHDWMVTGHVRSGAFREGDLVVQYFERARLELWPDGSVTRGLVGGEVLEYRHPGLISQPRGD